MKIFPCLGSLVVGLIPVSAWADPLPAAEYSVTARGGFTGPGGTVSSDFGSSSADGAYPLNMHLDWQGQYNDIYGDPLYAYDIQAVGEAYGTSEGIVRPLAIASAEAHASQISTQSIIGGESIASVNYFVRVTPTGPEVQPPPHSLPIRVTLNIEVQGHAEASVRIGEHTFFKREILSGQDGYAANYIRRTNVGLTELVQLRARAIAKDTMGQAITYPTSSMALADPVFALDQAQFDIDMGANTYPLAEHYTIELSPGIVPEPIEWCTVANPSNAADTNGYGAVIPAFRIGKHEVTNAQYIGFLKTKATPDLHGLYHPGMAAHGITRNGSDGNYTYDLDPALANRPVVFVSWFDAARYVNWIANGRNDGDTETGSYTLNGATSGIVPVNPGATIFLPDENQWYKAAYYNGSSETYALHAHQAGTISPLDANFGGAPSSVDIGSYPSAPGFYGTLDQAGNVWEWNDAVIGATNRGIRGGSWLDEAANLRSSSRGQASPSFESYAIGFRVAAVIP